MNAHETIREIANHLRLDREADTISFARAMDESDAKEASEREGWRSPQGYTGDNCEHCGRNRVLICNNGKHVCEKCAWDQDAHEYSGMPSA